MKGMVSEILKGTPKYTGNCKMCQNLVLRDWHDILIKSVMIQKEFEFKGVEKCSNKIPSSG